jgi:hypothetical protein
MCLNIFHEKSNIVLRRKPEVFNRTQLKSKLKCCKININYIAQVAANYHKLYCIQIVLEQVGRGSDKQGYSR